MSVNSTTVRFNSFIEQSIGLSLSEIIRMDNDEATAYIEKRNNINLTFDEPDNRVPRCGNPLLFLGRTISSKDLK